MGMLPERPAPTLSRARWQAAAGWVHWFGPGRASAMVVAIVAIAWVGWSMMTTSGDVSPDQPAAVEEIDPGSLQRRSVISDPDGFSLVTAPTTPAPIDEVLVHVAGAVQRPGVYRLEPHQRVIDAVDAAGGATRDAVLHAINLAAPLSDGQRVHVPIEGEPIPPEAVASSGSPSAGGAPAPISVNSASEAELVGLPGVGPVLAAAIVAHRSAHGPFENLDGLLAVTGVGPAKLEAMRPQATL